MTLTHSQEITLSLSTKTSISENLTDSLAVIKKHPNFPSVEKETKRILRALEKYGYLESSLVSTQKYSDTTVTATYYLGKKYTLLQIDYRNTPFTQDQIALVSKNTKENYFVIPLRQGEKVLERLNKLQTKNGNTFDKLSLTNINTQDTIVRATLKTSKMSKRIIDSIALKGYEKFPKSFITYHDRL